MEQNKEIQELKEKLKERVEALETELGLLWAEEVRCCDCNAKLDVELENREIIILETKEVEDVVEPEG